MISWISEKQFGSGINAVEFDQSVQLIAGRVLQINQSFFDLPIQRVNEGQYMYEAWRAFGLTAEIYFYLDLFANDGRRVKPLSFHLYSQFDATIQWKKLTILQPVLKSLGKTTIEHIASRSNSPNYELFVNDDSDGQKASIIYKYDNESEGEQLAEYLTSELGMDMEIYSLEDVFAELKD